MKASTLLLPTLLSSTAAIGAPLDPAKHALENFLCYRVKRPSSFQGIESKPVTDAFEDRNYDLKKLESLCNPVEVDGSVIRNPDAHLVCF